MAQLLAANNAASTLANSISNSSTSANLQAGTGALFPAPGAGQYFVLTFTSQTDPTDQEIVWVTAVTGDTITMTRAQEGTDAQAWDANDLADNLMTAGQLETLVQQYQAQAQAYNYAEDTGTANTYLAAFTPPITSAPTAGFPARVKIANTNNGPSTINLGWGSLDIVRRDGSDLIGNELLAGQDASFVFDGVHAQLQGIAPATPAAIAAGTDTQSAVTPEQLAAALGTQLLVTGQCYLNFTSNILLTLVPQNGNAVPVAGALNRLPGAGVTIANANVTINGTALQNLAASSVYLLALNQGNGLEFWSLGTGHSPDTTAGNVGVEVITGHPTKTLVGMIATDASSHFSSFLTMSWFNQKQKNQATKFSTDRSTTSGTMAEMNTEIRNSFLVWAGGFADWTINGEMFANGGETGVLVGVGFDGITPEQSISISGVGGGITIGLGDVKTGLTEGLHYATVLGGSTGPTLTLFAPPLVLGAGTANTPTILGVNVKG